MDPLQTQAQEKKSYGPLIGIIVIVVILVLGALYFWGQKVSTQGSSASDAAAAVTAAAPVSASDDVSAIENDLQASSSVSTSDLDNL